MTDYVCPLPGWHPNLSHSEVWQLVLEEKDRETPYKLPTYLLLPALMLLGLSGNLLALLVYGLRFPASTTKNFIMALAVFDLINCLVGMPFEMYDLRHDVDLDIPVACKIFRFFITLSACGSVTILVAVSVDRFRRICRAFRKQMSEKQSRVLIGALVLVSVVFALPALVLYGKQTEAGRLTRYGIELHDCSIDDQYKDGRVAAVYQYVLGGTWIISIVVLIVMYSFIIYKIHQQKHRREKLSSLSHDSSAALSRLKITSPENSSGDKRRPSLKSFSYQKHKNHFNCHDGDRPAHVCGTCIDNNPKAGHRKLSRAENVYHTGTKFLSRLFSRDVNPVFSDDVKGEEGNGVHDPGSGDSDDEQLPEVCESSNVRLIGYTNTSLNNYMDLSDGSGMSERALDDAPKETKRYQRSTSAGDRPRKYGRSYGSYHLCEPDPLRNQVSGRLHYQRGWVSQSGLVSQTPNSPTALENPKRSMSLCSLGECVVRRCQAIEQQAVPSMIKLENNEVESPLNHSPVLDKKESACLHSPNNQQPNKVNVNFTAIPSEPCNETCKFNYTKQTSNSPKRKPSSIREIKTSKVSIMMLMVTVGFILSYLPHLGIQIFKSLSPTGVARLLCTNPGYFVIHHIFIRSFFINNAMNPVIYSFYNQTFRDRCLKLLRSPKYLLQSSEHHMGLSLSQDNDTS